MKKLFRLIPVAAVSLVAFGTLAGCSSALRSAFREPEVTLVKVVPNGIGLRGGSVNVQLEVYNPNSFDLETDRINYHFEVLDSSKRDSSWVSVSKGVIDRKLQVGDGDRTIVEIPIDFNYSDFGAAARSIIDRGSFRYRVSGDVDLREPLRRTIPFTRTDNFNLSVIR